MTIIEKRISELTPYERNAKKHDETQIRNIAESLRRYGWKQPVVIDSDGVIIIGHGRVLAAERLGWEFAPCVVADDLTEDEIKELRIVDNKTNESAWDFPLLEAEVAEIDLSEFTFDFDFPSIVDADDFFDDSEKPTKGDKIECHCPKCGFIFEV